VLGHKRDTDRRQPGTHTVEEHHSVVLRTAVPPAVGAASVIPEWELPGFSARLPGVGAPDSTVEVLEAEDSQAAGVAGAFQEEVAEVEDKIDPPSFSRSFSERASFKVLDWKGPGDYLLIEGSIRSLAPILLNRNNRWRDH
jgi:hypothetical protein